MCVFVYAHKPTDRLTCRVYSCWLTSGRPGLSGHSKYIFFAMVQYQQWQLNTTSCLFIKVNMLSINLHSQESVVVLF